MKRSIAIIVLFFCLGSLQAKVTLPALMGDHMVLQRNSSVNIWGEAAAGAQVRVTTSWDGKSYPVKAAPDGRWLVSITTPEAGGPYQITISDGEPVVLNDVLIGEVWVCSGQSNMEMQMKGFPGQPVEGANEAIARAGRQPNLRLFTVKRAQSETPLDDCSGQWKVNSPGAAAEFSAIAYYFGRNLNEILDIPIGLISTSWSGSYIEAWIDRENLEGYAVPQDRFLASTLMFNAMIMPVVHYGIAGFIWYQGESNRLIPLDYASLMSRMVDLWRSKWGRGDLPFYFVQIAPYVYADGADGVSTALVRDQQLKAMHEIPNTGMAVTLDVGHPTNIHPAQKAVVGERLSYWALGQTYGLEGIAYRSPEYKSFSVDGNQVTVQFDFAENGLTPWDEQLEGFELAGADRVFYPARAKVNRNGRRNEVIVESDRVAAPVAVRYGWKNYTIGTLFNNQGLPVPSFRSDDWEVQTRY